MPTPTPSPGENRVFLAVTPAGQILGVIVPNGLTELSESMLRAALSIMQAKPEKERPLVWRQSPGLAKAWTMAEVHGRADWIVSMETLHRAAPVPFPRTSVLSLTDPA